MSRCQTRPTEIMKGQMQQVWGLYSPRFVRRNPAPHLRKLYEAGLWICWETNARQILYVPYPGWPNPNNWEYDL